MKKRRIVAIIMTLTFVLQISHLRADATYVVGKDVGASSDEQIKKEKLIYDSMTISEDQDWVQWANYFVPEIREEYIEFVSDSYNEENNIGIYTVKTGKVLDAVSISIDEISEYYGLDEYVSRGCERRVK